MQFALLFFILNADFFIEFWVLKFFNCTSISFFIINRCFRYVLFFGYRQKSRDFKGFFFWEEILRNLLEYNYQFPAYFDDIQNFVSKCYLRINIFF